MDRLYVLGVRALHAVAPTDYLTSGYEEFVGA